LPSPDGKLSARAALRWFEAGALLCGALFALVFQLRLGRRLPAEEDHRRAAEFLRTHAQPGDAVMLYPWWTERARVFLPGSLDVVAYLDDEGDPLIDFGRVWVYAQPNLPRADLAGFLARFEPGRRRVGEPERFGNVELRLYENGHHRPELFSATRAVATARVYLELPDRRVECPFDGRAHRCPGAPEQVHVGAEWHEVFYEARHCLWMHPPGGPGRLVAEFPSVPTGEELALEAGLIWEWALARGPGFTPVNVGVDDANGRSLLSLFIPAGLQQLQHASAASPAGGPMRLWIQSDQAEARGTCVELKSRGKPAVKEAL
jgi:hypothetical protein